MTQIISLRFFRLIISSIQSIRSRALSYNWYCVIISNPLMVRGSIYLATPPAYSFSGDNHNEESVMVCPHVEIYDECGGGLGPSSNVFKLSKQHAF